MAVDFSVPEYCNEQRNPVSFEIVGIRGVSLFPALPVTSSNSKAGRFLKRPDCLYLFELYFLSHC